MRLIAVGPASPGPVDYLDAGDTSEFTPQSTPQSTRKRPEETEDFEEEPETAPTSPKLKGPLDRYLLI